MIQNPISTMDDTYQKIGAGHPKVARGWSKIYDVIFNELHTKLDVITEIGIGNATCQLAWARTFPGKKIVGIDIASPSIQLCDENDSHTKQFTNAMNGVSTLHRLPMKEICNIDLYYNKNAYEMDVANQYLEIYGKQIFFINDGKQDGIAHHKFKESWSPLLLPGGVLLQERIARKGYDGIRINQMRKAVHGEWLVYDCREYVQFENPNANGFLGIWSHNPDHWADVLKDFKRVTDPESQIEPKYQLPDDDNILQ